MTFRSAVTNVVGAGRQACLLIADPAAPAILVARQDVELLLRCRAFKTLAAHAADRATEPSSRPHRSRAAIQRVLRRCARSGLMLSERQLLTAADGVSESVTPMAVITIEAQPGERDIAAREEYARRLASETGTPLDIIRFGLVGRRGATRNFHMLATAGQRLLCMDAEATPGAADIFPRHEQLLGASAASLVGVLGRDRSAIRWNDCDPTLLHSIASGRGRVMLTLDSAAAVIGLDNAQLLPPFMPAGGDEVAVFAMLLRKCYPDAVIARLPISVANLQPDLRADEMLMAVLSAVDADAWRPAGESRLRWLGEQLLEFSDQPFDEFRHPINLAMAAWLKSAEAASDAALARAQEIFRAYARLLIAWPVLVEAAKHLTHVPAQTPR